MNAEEMKIMVNDLFATTSPNFTPDGKPTLVIIPNESIEGRLK
jgi:DNA mismatch repair ATPase MutL